MFGKTKEPDLEVQQRDGLRRACGADALFDDDLAQHFPGPSREERNLLEREEPPARKRGSFQPEI
jgi:hypothetical protein